MIVLDGSPKGKEGKVDDKRFFYNLSESRIGFGSAGCDTIHTIYLSQRTQSADPNLRILISVIHLSFSPLFYAPQSPLVPIQIPPPPRTASEYAQHYVYNIFLRLLFYTDIRNVIDN